MSFSRAILLKTSSGALQGLNRPRGLKTTSGALPGLDRPREELQATQGGGIGLSHVSGRSICPRPSPKASGQEISQGSAKKVAAMLSYRGIS